MGSKDQRTSAHSSVFDRRRSSDSPHPATGRGSEGGRRADDQKRGAGAPASRDARSRDVTGRGGEGTRKKRATRDGREPLVIYMPPASIKALKIAALEHDTTASAIVTEAVSLWLRSARTSR
jgi:hypothetical protein